MLSCHQCQSPGFQVNESRIGGNANGSRCALAFPTPLILPQCCPSTCSRQRSSTSGTGHSLSSPTTVFPLTTGPIIHSLFFTALCTIPSISSTLFSDVLPLSIDNQLVLFFCVPALLSGFHKPLTFLELVNNQCV